jgi:hypothetical protein
LNKQNPKHRKSTQTKIQAFPHEMISNISSKRDLEFDFDQEFGQPAKKQHVDLTLSDAQVELIGMVDKLLECKAADKFPSTALVSFQGTLMPFLEQHSRRGNLVLRAMSAEGKRLLQVVVLAISCKEHGVIALTNDRAALDNQRISERKAPTKDWLSYLHFARKSSPLLSGIATSSLSVVKGYFAEATSDTDSAGSDEHPPADIDMPFLYEKKAPVEDDTSSVATLSVADVGGESEAESVDSIFSLSDEAVECFTYHQIVPLTAGEIASGGDDDYDLGWKCDSCGFEASEPDSTFDRCWICGKVSIL